MINSMERYLEVLIESFPKALTQKELAERANVSPSAVSKIKDRLFPLCEIEKLAFDSKLVLEPNFKLFRTIILKQLTEKKLFKTLRLVSTDYGELVINRAFDVHNYLSKGISFYSSVFSEEETKLMTKIVLRYLRSLKLPLAEETKFEKIFTTFSEMYPETRISEDEGFVLGILLGLQFKHARFDWPIESKGEIHTLIILRDKLFYTLKHLLMYFSEELSFFKSLDEREKREYRLVCRKAIEYYLAKIFMVFTESLEMAANTKNLSFDHRYKTVGSLIEESVIKDVLILPRESE